MKYALTDEAAKAAQKAGHTEAEIQGAREAMDALDNLEALSKRFGALGDTAAVIVLQTLLGAILSEAHDDLALHCQGWAKHKLKRISDTPPSSGH